MTIFSTLVIVLAILVASFAAGQIDRNLPECDVRHVERMQLTASWMMTLSALANLLLTHCANK